MYQLEYLDLEENNTYEEIIKKVVEQCFKEEKLEQSKLYVSITLTTPDNIHKINKQYRDVDRETDVLSFPLIDYKEPGDFSVVDGDTCDYFNPESGELMLGDIIISMDRVYEQAESYNHSNTRELAFLVAHSMLHLFGYDHIDEEERKQMEDLQEQILNEKGYTRDYEEN